MENSYEKIKKWFVFHKREIWIGACFVLVFLVGFGTGRYDRNRTAVQKKLPNNYSKNPDLNQKTTVDRGEEAGAGTVKGAQTQKEVNTEMPATAPKTPATKPKEGTDCLVKGNISGNNKIYHVKGGAFYDRTNPEMCFATEEEAKAAGFRKAAR